MILEATFPIDGWDPGKGLPTEMFKGTLDFVAEASDNVQVHICDDGGIGQPPKEVTTICLSLSQIKDLRDFLSFVLETRPPRTSEREAIR